MLQSLPIMWKTSCVVFGSWVTVYAWSAFRILRNKERFENEFFSYLLGRSFCYGALRKKHAQERDEKRSGRPFAGTVIASPCVFPSVRFHVNSSCIPLCLTLPLRNNMTQLSYRIRNYKQTDLYLEQELKITQLSGKIWSMKNKRRFI